MDAKSWTRARSEQIAAALEEMRKIRKALAPLHQRVLDDIGLADEQFCDARSNLSDAIIILENELNIINKSTWTEPAHEDD